MKIQESLNKAKEMLIKNKVEDAYMIARVLLSSILNMRPEKLVIEYDKEILKEDEEKYFNGIEKIIDGYPLQYLIGTKEFMKMEFLVNEDVLVPRADTEILVEEVIRICKEKNIKHILELCTGSGAIAISLAKYLKNIQITATDINEKALKVAIENKKRLLQECDETINRCEEKTENKSKQNCNFEQLLDNTKVQTIKFLKSDMFKNIDEKYDMIVANPPYIKKKEIEKYALKYEPMIALDGGEDGLKFYRIIINEGHKYLNTNGIMALEIGFDQKEDVINIAKNTGKYKNIYSLKDLGYNDRVIVLEADF